MGAILRWHIRRFVTSTRSPPNFANIFIKRKRRLLFLVLVKFAEISIFFKATFSQRGMTRHVRWLPRNGKASRLYLDWPRCIRQLGAPSSLLIFPKTKMPFKYDWELSKFTRWLISDSLRTTHRFQHCVFRSVRPSVLSRYVVPSLGHFWINNTFGFHFFTFTHFRSAPLPDQHPCRMHCFRDPLA